MSYSLKLFETRLLLFSTSVSASFRWSITRQLLAELSNSAGNRWEGWVSKWTANIKRRKMSFSVLASRSIKIWMRWAGHYVIIFVITGISMLFFNDTYICMLFNFLINHQNYDLRQFLFSGRFILVRNTSWAWNIISNWYEGKFLIDKSVTDKSFQVSTQHFDLFSRANFNTKSQNDYSVLLF